MFYRTDYQVHSKTQTTPPYGIDPVMMIMIIIIMIWWPDDHDDDHDLRTWSWWWSWWWSWFEDLIMMMIMIWGPDRVIMMMIKMIMIWWPDRMIMMMIMIWGPDRVIISCGASRSQPTPLQSPAMNISPVQLLMQSACISLFQLLYFSFPIAVFLFFNCMYFSFPTAVFLFFNCCISFWCILYFFGVQLLMPNAYISLFQLLFLWGNTASRKLMLVFGLANFSTSLSKIPQRVCPLKQTSNENCILWVVDKNFWCPTLYVSDIGLCKTLSHGCQ